MRQKVYTLPRHTNLASQGLRITACIVDFAITLALTLGFLFGIFQFVFAKPLGKYNDLLNKYQTESHLRVVDEKGSPKNVDNKIEVYEKVLPEFYLHYMAGIPMENEPVTPNASEPVKVDGKEYKRSEYFTVDFYNREVLGITLKDPDAETSTCLFTYQKDDKGNYLKDKIGVRREKFYDADTEQYREVKDSDVLSYYSSAYVAANYYLARQDYYKDASNNYNFILQAELCVSMILGGLISYVILPLFLKNGQTLGKKIFKMGLANYEGYRFHDYQLLLRFVPYFIMGIALLFPIWISMFLSLGIYIVVVLISFALMMASPKRCALHDFAARTIVIDLEGSTLFENELEEEVYIRKEDGLPPLEEEQDGNEAY